MNFNKVMIGIQEKNENGLQYAGGAILNPKSPFEDRIRRLRFGDMIVIAGHVAPKIKRFEINLCNELDGRASEYVMHLTPRFNENTIVRNSTINGKWGPEEKFGGLGGLDVDSDFECLILVHTDCFKVAFNGQHYCDYRHRLPYASVNKLAITGEVVISSVHVQPGPVGQIKHRDGTQPLSMPPITGSPVRLKQQPAKYIGSKTDFGGYKLATPYRAPIKGLKNNQVIFISGIPHSTADSFAINLRIGRDKGSDIAFHIRPHFNICMSAVNHLENEKWGRQKDVTTFPFRRGVHFDLIIKCESNAFQISVDNNHFTQFQHRIGDNSKISEFEVEGDVSIVHLRMC